MMILQKVPHTNSSESGFAIGLILMSVLLIAALVGALAVSSSGSASTSELEKSRTQASGLITQAEVIKNAVMRYHATGGETTMPLLISDLQAGRVLAQGFASPQGAEGNWVIQDMDFGISNYSGSDFVMLKVAGVDEAICQQVNSVLTGDSTIIEFTNAQTSGVAGSITAEQLRNIDTISMGCRNYNTGTLEERVFIGFIPKL